MQTAARRGLSAPTRLAPNHDLDAFCSGRHELDEWLKRRARKAEGASARTYIVASGDEVAGYYCIASAGAELETLPSKLRRNMPKIVPLAVLGRLAVAQSWQGQGLGADLLQDALKRIALASEVLGVRALLVHAIDDQARSFYMRQAEFLEFPADTRTLYLSIETIMAAIGVP